MNSIRRTAVRVLLGFAAAVAVGCAVAPAASAQPVDQASQVIAASTQGDLYW